VELYDQYSVANPTRPVRPRAEKQAFLARVQEPREEGPVAIVVRLGAIEALVAGDERQNAVELVPPDRTHLDAAHRRPVCGGCSLGDGGVH